MTWRVFYSYSQKDAELREKLATHLRPLRGGGRASAWPPQAWRRAGQVVGSEKPFVSYQALKALHFAVGALDPRFYPQLMEAMDKAQDALNSASVAYDSDRQKMLHNARSELNATIESLSVQGANSEGA